MIDATTLAFAITQAIYTDEIVAYASASDGMQTLRRIDWTKVAADVVSELSKDGAAPTIDDATRDRIKQKVASYDADPTIAPFSAYYRLACKPETVKAWDELSQDGAAPEADQ